MNLLALRLKLYVVVVGHFTLVVAAFFSLLVNPLVFMYYHGVILGIILAAPGQITIINVMFNRHSCPATRWENRMRVQLGMSEIDTFIKHYYIRPFLKAKTKLKSMIKHVGGK